MVQIFQKDIMNKKNNLTQKFFLVAAPVLATSILGISPSRAATFASSTSEFEFNNFVQLPPIFGANTNVSKASGDGQSFSAFADSQSRVVGNFEIRPDDTFSFDFLTDFNLATSVENSASETARASGDISFLLLDTDNNTILDFFDIDGKLVTKADGDFIELQAGDNVNLNERLINPNFGGLKESLQVSISGSYERSFAKQTNLALIESKRNIALAKAPEPSTGIALLLSGSFIGVALKRKRK